MISIFQEKIIRLSGWTNIAVLFKQDMGNSLGPWSTCTYYYYHLQ
jgi:hypothetical protein